MAENFPNMMKTRNAWIQECNSNHKKQEEIYAKAYIHQVA